MSKHLKTEKSSAKKTGIHKSTTSGIKNQIQEERFHPTWREITNAKGR